MANHASHAALPFPIKGARFTVQIPYLDSDGDPTDPTTPDTQVSKDGGAFAACAEEVTTITGSNGVGYITLSGAETDCSMLAIAAKVASGPKNTLLTMQPRSLADVETGTAQGGAAGSITLASGAAAFDLTGCFVRTTGGTGGGGTGGADNQVRRIVAYNTTSKSATVEPNWETAPDATTTYDILLPEGMTLGALKALNPATAGRTLGVESDGHGHADVKEWVGNAVTGDPSGRPDVNIEAIRDSFDAATALSNFSKTITVGAVNDASPSESIFDTDLPATVNGYYNGAFLSFVDGPAAGQTRIVAAYDGTSKQITVTPVFKTTPADTNSFVIWGSSYGDVRLWLSNAVALSNNNRPDVNIGEIAGETAAASLLETIARSGIRGSCTATTIGKATFSTDLTEPDNDHYNGMIISFLSGNNGDTARLITDYSGTNGTITVSPDLPNGTASGNNFVIWGTAAANLHAVHDDKDAAARFERYLDTTTAGSVTGTPDAGAFDTTLGEDTPNHYNGSYIGFPDGALDGQIRQITSYDGAGRIGVTPAFTEPPGSGNGFIIFGCSRSDVRLISGDANAADDLELLAKNTRGTDNKVLVSADVQDLTTTFKVYADVRELVGHANSAGNLRADYDGTGYDKAASSIGTCGSLADGAITSATFATDAITAAVVATGAWEEAADQVMIRATSNFEASAPKKSLATAVMQAVHRVDDDGTGNLDIYRSNGTVVHASRTITTNAALDPIDELGGAT